MQCPEPWHESWHTSCFGLVAPVPAPTPPSQCIRHKGMALQTPKWAVFLSSKTDMVAFLMPLSRTLKKLNGQTNLGKVLRLLWGTLFLVWCGMGFGMRMGCHRNCFNWQDAKWIVILILAVLLVAPWLGNRAFGYPTGSTPRHDSSHWPSKFKVSDSCEALHKKSIYPRTHVGCMTQQTTGVHCKQRTGKTCAAMSLPPALLLVE